MAGTPTFGWKYVNGIVNYTINSPTYNANYNTGANIWQQLVGTTNMGLNRIWFFNWPLGQIFFNRYIYTTSCEEVNSPLMPNVEALTLPGYWLPLTFNQYANLTQAQQGNLVNYLINNITYVWYMNIVMNSNVVANHPINIIQGILTHEWGHALGLAHTNNLASIMYPSSGTTGAGFVVLPTRTTTQLIGGVVQKVPSANDLLALQTKY